MGRVLWCAVSFLCAIAVGGCGPANLAPQTPLTGALAQDLRQYLAARGTIEHISAASLSVSLHGQSNTVDVAAGTTTFGGSTPVTPANLFQIGSNTKSFTATIILQLEAENKLNINQTVGMWLPQYPTWSNVTIRQLLNMTSGIATYDSTPAWESDFVAAPTSFMSAAKLIAYIDPNAPLPHGWLYSNTGYELAQLIIEKATGNSYATELQNRIINSLGLHNTYYNADIYPANIQSQMVSGYYFNPGEGLDAILSQDVKPFTVSWAQAAGGIVATPSDLTRWVRALFQGTILGATQRSELLSLVSQTTGNPISQVSASDAHGFGLGMGQAYQPALGGAIWFYEGETLGYRMLFTYLPAQDAVIAIGLNSQPAGTDDQIGPLVLSVYQTLKAYNQL
ncbi:MAG TPA: serine hydrolase domain-containing protein [Candidatus Rubrimentiphilum sp.]|nr:serine hydrolase domain-containing protein [Candidatus Rubrimentiphilum sp.]